MTAPPSRLPNALPCMGTEADAYYTSPGVLLRLRAAALRGDLRPDELQVLQREMQRTRDSKLLLVVTAKLVNLGESWRIAEQTMNRGVRRAGLTSTLQRAQALVVGARVRTRREQPRGNRRLRPRLARAQPEVLPKDTAEV